VLRRFAPFCGVLVIISGLSACTTTTINQSGKQNNACADHSACSQGPIMSSAVPGCQARALTIAPEIVSQLPVAVNHQESAGAYELAVSGYSWAGVFIKLPASGCGFDVNFDARLYPSATGPRTGYGFGFGACDTWSGTEPRGFEIQYSVYQDDNNKPWDSTGWIPLGYPNNLTPVNLPVDFNTHAWSISARGNELTFTEDEGVSSKSYSLTSSGAKDYDTALLPATCKNTGVFLRVYNTKVLFSDFSASELAS
jgi:hypothetical protein